MFALVQWSASREISIVSVSDILKSKEENEETLVRYGNKEYKAIIKRISDDKNYLEMLNVTQDGIVQIRKKELMEKNANKIREQRNIESSDQQGIDPLKTCRMCGMGRVQLIKDYNVWIDKVELDFILRWVHKPKEMVRRLLKQLVGENNLKDMVAVGRKTKNSVGRPAIEKDIYRAVEIFVNRKCTSKLSASEYTTCVNLMISSLRNPRRG